MNNHETHIKRCIELAKLGEGSVSPNPLVGSVVLDEQGNVIGEGYHQRYGEAHAEINALNQAGDKAKNGTIYVSLEPCCHYGKTPPCIDRVIESGIKKLVIGMPDPNSKVAGKSIKMAKAAGIEVVENILSQECQKLNEVFVKHIVQHKPFIAIKTASTMDGKIATSSGQSKWITSENAREEVHRLRNKYDAILTGSGTVLADDPSLTCRAQDGRNPVRIVIDSGFITPVDAKVYQDDGTRVIIVGSETTDKKYPGHVEIWECPKHDLNYLFERLYKEDIYSVMVEAGAGLNGALVESNLVDKIYFFLAPKLMGNKAAMSSFEGIDLANLEDCTKLSFGEVKQFPPDLMVEGYLE